MVSVGGGTSLRVKASLISTGGIDGAVSSTAGDPFGAPLGRQLCLSLQVFQRAFSFRITNEKPKPSVIGYQLLSNVNSRIFSLMASSMRRGSPRFSSVPTYWPAASAAAPLPYRDVKAARFLT